VISVKVGLAFFKYSGFIDPREVFDEPTFLSTDTYRFGLNPPIVPKLVRLLTPIMAEDAVESLVQKMVRLWKDFGSRQSTLEQWL